MQSTPCLEQTHQTADTSAAALLACNDQLAGMTAAERVRHALDVLPDRPVLSSSFGAQSAVLLHLMTRELPDIPVVVVDTGYLFPETYRFIDQLTEQLALNLQVYRSPLSAAWLEARHGKQWEHGVEGITDYNQRAKVEPMQRALDELGARTWFAGLRRSQSAGRALTPFVQRAGDRYKVHPIADWSDRDVYRYLQRHQLPYHPLWEKGYVSIGDTHTTRSVHEVNHPDETRFFGLKRECGLHEISDGD